jgi:hypothetical protein
MSFKTLVVELRTGIVLNAKTQNWYLGNAELPYEYFEDLSDVSTFATSLLKKNNGLEISVWDEDGNYIQTLNSKSL